MIRSFTICKFVIRMNILSWSCSSSIGWLHSVIALLLNTLGEYLGCYLVQMKNCSLSIFRYLSPNISCCKSKVGLGLGLGLGLRLGLGRLGIKAVNVP